MLIRSTWTLTTESSVSLPKSYNIELVKLLHSRLHIEMGSEAVPSTTFAGLLGKCSTSKEFVSFQPNEFYQLSLSGLQESSSKAISDLDLGEQLQFLGTTFKVINREDEITTYEALYHDHVANEPEPTRHFEFQFSTPTAFSQNRLYLPLPVPTLMFRSWLERWNHFAPVPDFSPACFERVPLTRQDQNSRVREEIIGSRAKYPVSSAFIGTFGSG